MKKLKMTLFSMLLLFVGVLTVDAGSNQADITQWGSVAVPISKDVTGNCSESSVGPEFVDTFLADGNKTCVITGLAPVTLEAGGYLVYGQVESTEDSIEGQTYYGGVAASDNDTSNTIITLREIVELIYNENSSTTKKLKQYALSQSYANGATKYILKAGATNDALYVYGGYENGKMSAIKINFNESTKRFSYSITYDSSNEDEFIFASMFSIYLVDYLMEAAPDYDKAIAIVNDETKMSKIENSFAEKYGQVKTYTNPTKLEIDLLVDGGLNSEIVSLYEASLNDNTEAEKPESDSTNTNTNTNTNNNTNNNNNNNNTNPNTGSFVNIFAIVALISVGTVIVLGNKRKLFKI